MKIIIIEKKNKTNDWLNTVSRAEETLGKSEHLKEPQREQQTHGGENVKV